PFLLLSAVLLANIFPAFANDTPAHSPQLITAEQDHARVMQELGIASLRRGADGDPKSPHAANYDEAKANAKLATLPNVLISDEGKKIKAAKAWWKTRRPEIVEHFDKEIYGRVPANVPALKWKLVASEHTTVADKKILVRTLEGQLDNSLHP